MTILVTILACVAAWGIWRELHGRDADGSDKTPAAPVREDTCARLEAQCRKTLDEIGALAEECSGTEDAETQERCRKDALRAAKRFMDEETTTAAIGYHARVMGALKKMDIPVKVNIYDNEEYMATMTNLWPVRDNDTEIPFPNASGPVFEERQSVDDEGTAYER